jgi:hypothetical protein
LVLTKTEPGRNHDLKELDRNDLVRHIPEDVLTWLDKGFIGILNLGRHLKIMIPKKKPKGKELSEEEKIENSVISSLRIISEHTMCGIKRLKCITDVYRNKYYKYFADKFMLIACGLWNLHLNFGS